MKTRMSIVVPLLILAATSGCKPVVGRYQIATISAETATVARLDTVTGEVIIAGFSQGGTVKQLSLLSPNSAENPTKP